MRSPLYTVARINLLYPLFDADPKAHGISFHPAILSSFQYDVSVRILFIMDFHPNLAFAAMQNEKGGEDKGQYDD